MKSFSYRTIHYETNHIITNAGLKNNEDSWLIIILKNYFSSFMLHREYVFMICESYNLYRTKEVQRLKHISKHTVDL